MLIYKKSSLSYVELKLEVTNWQVEVFEVTVALEQKVTYDRKFTVTDLA